MRKMALLQDKWVTYLGATYSVVVIISTPLAFFTLYCSGTKKNNGKLF